MSTLSPDRWKEISPHLDQALSLSVEERAAWLKTFRTERPELADLLEKLLEEHRAIAQEHFLEHPPLRPMDESALSGQTIGAYRLIACIGQGGMGSVWLAERSDGRFERRVAIKFLHFAVAAQGGAERFKREGSILGRLANPHIAELMDAGVTAKGEPYLVLEYVEGEPIDQYCDHRRLDVDSRIRLFLDILSAVAQAHANLIVHRDLKPSNVLVRKDGQVKLLDFGIAKLLADETSAETPTLLTLEGGGALTPLFAAPEQIAGGTVTTATDVYALGVLLYLLLTGQHPAGPGPHSAADLVKAITETEPLRASVAPASADVKAAAEVRSTTPEKLRRQLFGDLDTIIAKAVKKTPAERYSSVPALAEDLERYLRHEPVSARPDALTYRIKKYVRRHRAGVAAAAGLVLLLAGVAVVQAVQLRRITRERDRADRIARFMTDMFKASDPSEARGNNITAREILDKASKEIDPGLAKDPELQAHMMSVMGEAYSGLGLYFRAEPLLARAIEIRRSSLGPQHPETLKSKRELGWVLMQESRFPEAERLERETLNDARRVLGVEHADTLFSMNILGATLIKEGRYADAAKLERETFDIERRVLGSDNPTTLATMQNLGAALYADNQYAEAEKLERETLEIDRRVLGPEHPNTLSSMSNLALILMQVGRYPEAERLEREALDIERRVLGPEHPNTLDSMRALGQILTQESRYAEAEKVVRQALEADRRLLGPDHQQTVECISNLAGIAARKGNTNEAISLIQEAIDHGLLDTHDAREIEEDSDFISLRGNPRFTALFASVRERAAARKTN